MSVCEIKIEGVKTKGGKLFIDGRLFSDALGKNIPRLKAVFSSEEKTRRIPVPVLEEGEGYIVFGHVYLLDKLFFNYKFTEDLKIGFELWLGDEQVEIKSVSFDCELPEGVTGIESGLAVSKKIANKKTYINIFELDRRSRIKRIVYTPMVWALGVYFGIYKKFHPVKKNRVTFMSGRRQELGGNMEFVWKELEKEKDIELKTMFFSQTSMTRMVLVLFKFLKLYSTSRVVVVDDFFRFLNTFKRQKDTRIIQLWHACGAFKTFGYTRLGKPGGPHQYDKNHRMYDYAVVSSSEIARHYAEGFGISDSCILPSGVPRTDIFFDEGYSKDIKEKLYQKYPVLKDKKVLLFAPTFRGNGQITAVYDISKIDINELKRNLGDEWAVIIKLHPFCRERFEIADDVKDSVIDLSNEDELNDLLFITDLLVTDYSSCIFEASLLNIPMVFYVFDLEEYIRDRDFYYEFEGFAPGKIVKTEDELFTCIKEKDFEQDKIKGFKNKFFDNTDGKSSKRVADKIIEIVRGGI